MNPEIEKGDFVMCANDPNVEKVFTVIVRENNREDERLHFRNYENVKIVCPDAVWAGEAPIDAKELLVCNYLNADDAKRYNAYEDVFGDEA
jgi:hypothetical protein